jgi:Glycine zipper
MESSMLSESHPGSTIIACCLFAGLIGCRSPYYADRGALAGGLTGAGVGALVGNAVGETAGGAAIGAGIGALTGGAIGGGLDDIEARNRAEIAAQLGRPVALGQATVGEVVAMTRAGVDPRLIANYVNNSGMVQPVSAQDVIYLTQQGVSPDVIHAMQTPRVAQVPAPIVAPPPGPVIIEEYHYGPPPYCPPHYYHFHGHHRHRGPRFGWGVSFSG